jgi:NAD(P)-dependent dehydrogenase (short-subunit alcohol dehydrogenase family)
MSYHPVDIDLSGRVALVTGATSGMGKQTARELTRMGADVIIGCRDRRRGELASREIAARGVTVMDVLTPLTRDATGWLKLLIRLTSFAAQAPLDGADTTIWAAASPQLAGVTAKFWSSRHEIRCRFRDRADIQELRALVEQQLTDAGSLIARTDGHGRAKAPSRCSASPTARRIRR